MNTCGISIKTGWARVWGNFEKKHPKLAKWLYQIFYFFVFSMGVTIIQYLFFTFMPGLLGKELAGTEFMWPQIDLELFGVPFTWSLLGYNVLYEGGGRLSSAAVWAILSVTKWDLLWRSALTSRFRETLLSKAMGMWRTRQCGILSHGL